MLAALTLFVGTAAAILGLFSLLEEEGLQCAIRIAAERRDSAKGMTLPATRRVILCGMRGSRTPQRSNEVAKTVSGCQMQASSS